MMNFELEMRRGKIEAEEKWKELALKIPALNFNKEWDVKIIPPFAGAMTRFWIDYCDRHVSVYFDAYSRLGWMVDSNEEPIPYYEAYDGNDTVRFLLGETDKMMSMIDTYLNAGTFFAEQFERESA